MRQRVKWHKLPQLVLTMGFVASMTVGCGSDDSGGSSTVTCGPGERLVDGECRPNERDVGTPDGDIADADLSDSCVPSSRICSSPNTTAICEENGTYRFEDCLEGFICSDGYCIDSSLTCTPDANLGCQDDHSYRVCNSNGQGFDIVQCPVESPNCLGSGMCTHWVCIPSDTRCDADDAELVEVCLEDGSGWTDGERCDPGVLCSDGSCLSPCEANEKEPSFLGCDYWAVDLDNIEEPCDFGECRGDDQVCNTTRNVCEPSAASQQFSISVSNPHETPVDVTIQNSSTSAINTVTVPAQTSEAIPLDRLDVNGTGRTRNAYHVTTTLPVTAHQFNPSNNVGVFSNDASLLLPTNAAGRRYIVMGWPTGPFGTGDHAYAYVTIVAVNTEGITPVRITPSVNTRGGGTVGAIVAGVTQEFILSHGEVLSLQTEGIDGSDLSGTVIDADEPVIVFAGHECAFVPDEGPTPYCDHMEQQLYPVEAWGTQYFGAKLSPRGTEIDVWRVVASESGTVLTTDPPVSGVNGLTVDIGEVIEFTTSQSFELNATKPVLLGQFMTGSNYPGIDFTCWQTLNFGAESCAFGPPYAYDGDVCGLTCSGDVDCAGYLSGQSQCIDSFCKGGTGVGDPAFMLAVPATQYRDNYIFLTPADYRDDWFTVIAPIGTDFVFDGSPIAATGLTPIGDTGLGLLYQSTSNPAGGADPAQAHVITGSAPFALQVYGYDCDVSYAYPGGLNLERDE